MTLDEAIQHCIEKASECKDTECALEHRQLARWLEELRQRRMKEEISIWMRKAAEMAGLC